MTAGGTPDLLGDAPARARARATYADPAGCKIINVRTREAEYESFSQQVREFGLTNKAMRIAARRIDRFLETNLESRNSLQEIANDIGRIAEALNQLNLTAERDSVMGMDRLTRHCEAFGHEFAALEALLFSVLKISRRRHAGRRMLREAGR